MQQKIKPILTILNESFLDENRYNIGEKITQKDLDKFNIKLPKELETIYTEECSSIYFTLALGTVDSAFNLLPINNIVTLYDFFKEQCEFCELDMSLNYSKPILQKIEEKAKNVFVFATSGDSQFSDIFAFDEQGQLYFMEYDNDLIFTYYENYIKELHKFKVNYSCYELVQKCITNLLISYETDHVEFSDYISQDYTEERV